MSDTAKLIIAVLGVFAAGFFIVGTSEKSEEEKKSDAFVAAYSSMTKMANDKCPKAIKKETGSAVYFPSNTDTGVSENENSAMSGAGNSSSPKLRSGVLWKLILVGIKNSSIG